MSRLNELASVGLATMLLINGCSGNRPDSNVAPSLGNRRADLVPTPLPSRIPEGFIPIPVSTQLESRYLAIPNTNVLLTQLEASPYFNSNVSRQGIEALVNGTNLRKFRRVIISMDPHTNINALHALNTGEGCDGYIQMGYTGTIDISLGNQINMLTNEKVEQLWNQYNQGLLWRFATELSDSTTNCVFKQNDALVPKLDAIQKGASQQAPLAIWSGIRPNFRIGVQR